MVRFGLSVNLVAVFGEVSHVAAALAFDGEGGARSVPPLLETRAVATVTAVDTCLLPLDIGNPQETSISDTDISTLSSMFPSLEISSINSVLQRNNGNTEKTVDELLQTYSFEKKKRDKLSAPATKLDC